MRKLHLSLLIAALFSFGKASFGQFYSFGKFLAVSVSNDVDHPVDGCLIQFGDKNYVRWDTGGLNNHIIDINGNPIVDPMYRPTREFTDTINGGDAAKFGNSHESFSVLRRGVWYLPSLIGPDVIINDHEMSLGIEKCSFIGTEKRYGLFFNNDTFPIKALKLGSKQLTYKMYFFTNLPGYSIKLEDSLGPGMVISNLDTALPPQFYQFTVDGNDAAGMGTKNPNRFNLIMSNNASFTPRFAFTHVGGVRDAGGIHLDWDAIGESMVASYEVQHLEHGDFVTLGFAAPLTHTITGSVGIEAQTLRIKATLSNGTVVYSDTLKLPAVLAKKPFSILPNITTGSSSVVLQFDRDLYGPSELVIFNTNGTPVLKKPIVGQTGERVNLPNLSQGLYIVKVGKMVQKLVIQ